MLSLTTNNTLSLGDISYWHWLIAMSISCYHGYRGFMLQWIFAQQQNEQLAKERIRQWRISEIIMIRCVEDMLFYFVSSLAGFFALLVANNLASPLIQNSTIDIGVSILLTFFFSIGVIGVSGQLPHVVQHGKFPYLKS